MHRSLEQSDHAENQAHDSDHQFQVDVEFKLAFDHGRCLTCCPVICLDTPKKSQHKPSPARTGDLLIEPKTE
jgi:hypothetical protein